MDAMPLEVPKHPRLLIGWSRSVVRGMSCDDGKRHACPYMSALAEGREHIRYSYDIQRTPFMFLAVIYLLPQRSWACDNALVSGLILLRCTIE